MPPWDDYQEEVAEFFRNIGLEAETNVTLSGTRTSHDIDVVVRLSHVGFDLLWLVECKHWKTPVPKLHVMGLRQIVIDVGADRGIIVAENGFQSGSKEAAELTNVQLTSLADLRRSAAMAVGMAELRSLYDRVENAKERYWELGKDVRISHGLRPEVGAPGFSARAILDQLDAALSLAFRGRFPVDTDDHWNLLAPGRIQASSPQELARIAEEALAEIENRLDTAEQRSTLPRS